MKAPLFCTAFVILLGAASAGTLTLERTIPLPGVRGRIDHYGLDATGGRLFVAALGNKTVEVVDLKPGKVIRSLTGLISPQGVFYLAEFRSLCVASASDGTLRFFDDTSYAQTNSLTLGLNADNVRYDPATKQIFVGYGSGGLAIVDAMTGKTVANIPLSAHPESFQIEKAGPRVFVNVPSSRLVAVVDRQQRKVVATWHVASAGGNFPMALDESTHRLYVGCRTPALLLIIDTEQGKEVGHVDLHGDCDDLFFDAARHQLYASCGGGFIDVFAQSSADHCDLKESVATVEGARTCYFDGEQIYLAVPRRGSQSAEIHCYRVNR